MKAFFRFLRGELNGFYLNHLHNLNNDFKTATETKSFLTYFKHMQFKSADEVVGDEEPISAEMIKQIGSVAGVFTPYVLQESIMNSVHFTDSHKVDDIEYSERGLFNLETESFDFIRTTPQEYSTDINTEATTTDRSSLVEEGRTPIGYFPEGVNVIDADGNLDYSKLLPSPRPNHADAPFYGDKFLFLAENYPVLGATDAVTMLKVIEAEQWVRYNGVSISSLVEFAKIFCEGFLFIVSISWDSLYAHGVINYGLDNDYETPQKLLKQSLFKFLVQKKFEQITFNEVPINVIRDESGNVISVETE